MNKLLCREIVWRRVRLLNKVTTGGGWSFAAGRVMECIGTYNGKFNLKTLRRPPPIVAKDKHGNTTTSYHCGISGVGRGSFIVL